MDEYEYSTRINGLDIKVDKVGGGTLGRSYDGGWTVTVMNGDKYIFDEEHLHTATPKTHEAVGEYAYDFATATFEVL